MDPGFKSSVNISPFTMNRINKGILLLEETGCLPKLDKAVIPKIKKTSA